MLRRLLISLQLITLPLISAQDFDLSYEYGFGRTTYEGDEEYTLVQTKAFGELTHNPDNEERQRLIVEWGPAKMGYVNIEEAEAKDKNGSENLRKLTWKDSPDLRQDRVLSIRGRLLIESEDGKTRRPIDWIQGIRVIVSKHPDKQHDWSSLQEKENAEWGEYVIHNNGEFMVVLSPGEIRRTVGKDSRFQVALSLAEKGKRNMTWRNTFGVLPRSVSMITIPGPPPISRTMRIINGAPPDLHLFHGNFNPAPLIRAVNHLIPMGKERAIHELREYVRIARDNWDEEYRSDENIDTSDFNRVISIAHTLFENPDLEMMSPDSSVPDKDPRDGPLYQLHLQDDTPFALAFGVGGSSGMKRGPPDSYLDWIEKHGKMRTTLLKPIDNPILAVQHLLANPKVHQWEELREMFKTYCYSQAWQILLEADQDRIAQGLKPALPQEDLSWQQRIEAALKLDIHWDEQNQKYIIK